MEVTKVIAVLELVGTIEFVTKVVEFTQANFMGSSEYYCYWFSFSLLGHSGSLKNNQSFKKAKDQGSYKDSDFE